MPKFCQRCNNLITEITTGRYCDKCRNLGRRKIANQEIIDAIKSSAVNGQLSFNEFKDKTSFSNSFIKYRLGSWENACKQAGIMPKAGKQSGRKKKKLVEKPKIEEVQKERRYLLSHIATEVGKSSTMYSFYQKGGLPNPSGFTESGKPYWHWDAISPWIEKYRNGEIPRASRKRSEEKNQEEKKYRIAELARIIGMTNQGLYSQYNRGNLPEPSGFSKAGKPYWVWEAISPWIDDYKAGPIRNYRGAERTYSDEDMLDAVRKVANGLPISFSDYIKSRQKPASVTILNRFKTDWLGICRLAGVEHRDDLKRYSEEDIRSTLLKAAKKIDGPFTLEAYRETGLKPAGETLMDKYGSWRQVCNKFGLKYSGYERKRVDQIAVLKNTLEKLGHIPVQVDYSGPPSVPTLRRRGFTYLQAVEAAGYDVKASRSAGKLVLKNVDRKERDRLRKEKLRQELIAAGQCPQCKGDWIEPRETHRGKPQHCKNCQDYYSNRYEKKKEQKG